MNLKRRPLRISFCLRAGIPLRDDDTVQSVMDMAVAAADFGDASPRLEYVGDKKRIARAYEAVCERLGESEAKPAGP